MGKLYFTYSMNVDKVVAVLHCVDLWAETQNILCLQEGFSYHCT